MKTDREMQLDSLMRKMPEEWRSRWCNPGSMGCGCLGCSNYSGGLLRHGFTQEDHSKWLADNVKATDAGAKP